MDSYRVYNRFDIFHTGPLMYYISRTPAVHVNTGDNGIKSPHHHASKVSHNLILESCVDIFLG